MDRMPKYYRVIAHNLYAKTVAWKDVGGGDFWCHVGQGAAKLIVEITYTMSRNCQELPLHELMNWSNNDVAPVKRK